MFNQRLNHFRGNTFIELISHDSQLEHLKKMGLISTRSKPWENILEQCLHDTTHLSGFFLMEKLFFSHSDLEMTLTFVIFSKMHKSVDNLAASVRALSLSLSVLYSILSTPSKYSSKRTDNLRATRAGSLAPKWADPELWTSGA